jgi:flagellar basal-body rod protein FlgB
VDSLAVFSLASQRASWLAAREATIASNVANANTPGYKAQDVTPFASVLARLQLKMTATEPGHMQPASLEGSKTRVKPSDSWDVVYSGNSVNLEQEMLKAGEIGSAHALDVGVVRSFHQMLINTVKS